MIVQVPDIAKGVEAVNHALLPEMEISARRVKACGQIDPPMRLRYDGSAQTGRDERRPPGRLRFSEGEQ
ncbi:hypothetical protein [Rhizobium sp. SSA_523]|uniref:hypothetical protein n=1 Tax=Rhizobium sp. SSA_523 TaxID=2952477 RepID=UPI002090D4EF|nr:hypothetical protein [Rhizobium sp. SSA_523]MCO5730365.1 hypothetical protein [Rhizobium sp. SSA_523]WKC25409.1 hypothetical protein QTJ18_15715 [Rhizobium sp. SSA_523]